MKVAVFGGTGYVGSYIVEELVNQGFTPRLLVRNGSEKKIMKPKKCEIFKGDIDNTDIVEEVISQADVVIYLIAVIREFPRKGITWEKLQFKAVRSCIDISKTHNVKKFILMSANGVKPHGTNYQKTKFMADEYLKNSGLNYTIFRPTSLFGDPRGNGRPEFNTQILNDMLSLPIPAPLFHNGLVPLNAGEFSFSPIHVKDVASIFVKSINNESMLNKIYNLGGPDKVSWKNMIKTVSQAVGKKKFAIPAPVFVVKSIASIFKYFKWFPVTPEQLTMIMEDNTCESKELFENLKINPIQYNAENLSYLNMNKN